MITEASCPSCFSYAPGVVEEVFDDFSCSVIFYDGKRSVVEREDIYISDKDTHERDESYIRDCEQEMVGQAVVARDDNSGEYKLGKSLTGNYINIISMVTSIDT